MKLRSDLCDFNDAYIMVKGTITVTERCNTSRKNRPLAFKSNASFISCISKIINMLIDNAKDLDVVTPMYNLIKSNTNFRNTRGNLWNDYRDELRDDTSHNNNWNRNIIHSESFKCKTSIIGSTYNVDARTTNAEGNAVNNPADDANKSV